jgi:small subunit ribosomal protein S21
MEVVVRDNNVMKAYRKLKKKLHDEGVIQELIDRRHFQKPSDVKRQKRKEAAHRAKKKQAKRLAEM